MTFIVGSFSGAFTTAIGQGNIIESCVDNFGVEREGSISLVESPRRDGSRAFRHNVPDGGNRSEFAGDRVAKGGTYWYGWSFYHPGSPAIPRGGWTILSQWFIGGRDAQEWPCGGAGHKVTTHDGILEFNLQHSTSGGSAITCRRFELASFDEIKDKWVDVVVHARWTDQTNGFVKLWIRIGGDAGEWEQKVNYTGRSQANGSNGPYFKFGAYTDRGGPRVVYTDEYRLGNATASFEEVAPGGNNGGSPGNETILEAESAALSGSAVATNQAGYTGSGFADMGGQNSYVQWNYTAPSAGTYRIKFRYGNGGSANRPARMDVNGASAGTLDFAPTSGWTSWQYTPEILASLNAGANTIRLTAATSAGGANIDHLQITDNEAASSARLNFEPLVTEPTMVVYPNPTSAWVSWQSSEPVEGVQVFNAVGQVVQTVSHPVKNQLDVRSLKAGTYLLRITTSRGVQTQRLVKH